MSWQFQDQVWENKHLTTTQKIVALSLASHADKNGECFPSLGRIMYRCSLSRRAVQNALDALEGAGCISIAKNAGRGGANKYRFSAPKSATEIDLGGASGAPPSGLDGVHVVPEGVHVVPEGVHVVPEGVHVVRPNLSELPITIQEPVAQSAVDVGFDDFWKSHPRPLKKSASQNLFNTAVAEGVEPALIIAAASAFAAKEKGKNLRYVLGSNTWLDERRWNLHAAETAAASVKSGTPSPEAIAAFFAEWVNGEKPIPQSAVSASVARHMLELKLVTPERLRTQGVLW
jgi:hypothetical protein